MITYQTTHLEDTIEKLYNQLGIDAPANFNMDHLNNGFHYVTKHLRVICF
ncbi:hypothetical protein [Halalkalibacter sp. APA_J-10(15)]|nr:hypothetical protein [Halalkalibacter sp. APA_J-10(15)]MCK0470405.1 hypothetical protein [Halalkalibacter sp. APA_J-10(15)]